MIYFYAEIQKIDYGKLAARIQEENKPQNLLSFLLPIIKPFASLAAYSWIMNPIIKSVAKKIEDLANEYGIYFVVFEINPDTPIDVNTGGQNMLNVSASIESIDFNKLLGIVSELASNKKTDNDKNRIIGEVIRIIKPFIGKTMETIPSSAIAELFDLLARDKIIELADNFGVKVSSVSVNG